MKNKINELKNLYDSLINIKYKPTKNKNIIETHKYNLNLQEETYNKIISYLDSLLNEINNIENIKDYHDDLIKLSTTNNKVPTLKELNISNYISLRSINFNKKLTLEINKFYREINEIIDNIQKENQRIENIKTEINNLNNKINLLEKEKNNKLLNIKREKERINVEIENLNEKLNKTFIFNIFKRDSIYSKIDLLTQEYKQYEENTTKLNNDYEEKISKIEIKINELKNTLNKEGD